jgi:LuxR family transcriptional regulator, maltose regulon positive regulatory protein
MRSFVDDLQSGRDALRRGQWDDARNAFERLLRSERTPEVLEGYGWALYWLDQPEASLEVREEAYRLYVQRDDSRSAARVATGLGVDYADFAGFAVTAGWLQRARRLLDPLEEGPEHGWLALWEGHVAHLAAHDSRRARELATRALEIGRRLRVSDLEFLALALEGLLLVQDGAIADGMRQLDEATAAALAGEMSDVDSVAQTCCLLVHACERVRDYDRAAQWSQRIERFANRYATGSLLALCRVQHAAMLIGLGEWREAEKVIDASREVLVRKRPMLVDEALLQIAELRRRQGRIAEAEEIFRRHEAHTEAMIGLAAIAIACGDAGGALVHLDRFARKPLAEKWVQRAVAASLACEASTMAGDIAKATAHHERLRELAAELPTDMIRAIERDAAAVVAECRGESSSARLAAEESVELFTRAAAPFEAARARVRLAQILRNLGSEALAAQELRSACEAFEALGAAGELARGREIEERIAATKKQRGPLTRRETEVLGLVARGMSDKEVAAKLSLSEHTVHRHVANILGKLSLPSRAAAVAEASRLGILAR